MIEIAPGVSAGIVQETRLRSVHVAIAVECEGQVNTCYLNEREMDALQGVLLNAIQAAQIVRGEREKHRKGRRFPARAP